MPSKRKPKTVDMRDEMDRADLRPHLRDVRERFLPGDRLILDGPARGGWADSLPRRPWVVVECPCGLCSSGSHVAIDVELSPAMRELYPESGRWRHVSSGALRRKGEPSQRQANEWADWLACTGGQSLSWRTELGENVNVLRDEWTSLALADSLGGTELTEEQARQLAWLRAQHGGQLTEAQAREIDDLRKESKARGR